MASQLKRRQDMAVDPADRAAWKAGGRTATPIARHVVLVAEDDPDLLDVLSRQLDLERYHFVLTADGQEALDLLALLRPALVIFDWRRPTVGRRRVLSTIREWHGGKAPILVLSADPETEATRDGEADAFLRKPYSIPDLVGAIQRLLAA